jgi:hypothetical protein
MSKISDTSVRIAKNTTGPNPFGGGDAGGVTVLPRGNKITFQNNVAQDGFIELQLGQTRGKATVQLQAGTTAEEAAKATAETLKALGFPHAEVEKPLAEGGAATVVLYR